MGIIDTLFKRFKEKASAEEKARQTANTPSNPTNENPDETSTSSKPTLAQSVLEIQKMDRKKPKV
ncbi:MAG: hypothetical protein JSS07_11020 [Proteobacteria bacterium]|nr:hypothetical protein [Pseudomonadota bacterium]